LHPKAYKCIILTVYGLKITHTYTHFVAFSVLGTLRLHSLVLYFLKCIKYKKTVNVISRRVLHKDCFGIKSFLKY